MQSVLLTMTVFNINKHFVANFYRYVEASTEIKQPESSKRKQPVAQGDPVKSSDISSDETLPAEFRQASLFTAGRISDINLHWDRQRGCQLKPQRYTPAQ